MSSVLCFTVRFLDPLPQYHGRDDDGEPEWPPSPLRFFQALVSAAATRWRERQFQQYARPALEWLEARQPEVVAPSTPDRSYGFRMYVPNNSGDLMTAAWARGDTETTMAKFRVEKDMRPLRLGGDAVRFLYACHDGCTHVEVLRAAARSVTHLGWGIDMVAGDAELLDARTATGFPGEVWRPAAESSGQSLRVPIAGTVDALLEKHRRFLGRLSGGSFAAVPPLAAFRTVPYRRATDPAARPWCAFALVKPDGSGNRAFDTPRRARDVAAWVRHAVDEVCRGASWDDRASFVHGHDPQGRQLKGDGADRRFMYLPMPTINHALNRVESIRRVLIAAPPGCGDRIAWLRRRLPMTELVWNGEIIGLLEPLPASDWVLQQYVKPASAWTTVTPVVWPGFDDHDPKKAEALLRKALIHAGLAQELVDKVEELSWRSVGFRAGTDLAGSYARPSSLKGRAYHVRLRFPQPIPGPLAVGAGRYRGLGLFVRDDD